MKPRIRRYPGKKFRWICINAGKDKVIGLGRTAADAYNHWLAIAKYRGLA